MEQTGSPISENREFYKDNYVFHDAVHLAIEVAEATGGNFPTKGQYLAMYEHGYTACSPVELARVFYDWQDYHDISQTFYDDHLAAKQAEEQKMLKAIEEETALGLLPEELFKSRYRYSVVSKLGTRPEKPKTAIRIELSDETVPDEEKLQRYARYTLINYCLRNNPNETEMPEDRKISIVLGFNIKTGKFVASLRGALMTSNKHVQEVDIDDAAQHLGIYEYAFSQERKSALKRIENIVSAA